MSNRYDECFVTCDTREQSALFANHKTESAIVKDKFLISDYSENELYKLSKQRPRITAIYNYFSKRGAEVGIGKLDRCDYFVSGFHRDREMSLGIEYKQLSDFFGSHEDLPWKLWESQGIYHDVALCIEGLVDIESRGDFEFVKNWAAESILRYDLYQARLAEWQMQGVNVRTFEKLDHFAPTFGNLIDFVSKESHRSFEYREPCNANLVLKMLCQVPGMKLGTVSKLLKDNPKMTFAELNQMEMKDVQKKIGKVTGEKLYNLLHKME